MLKRIIGYTVRQSDLVLMVCLGFLAGVAASWWRPGGWWLWLTLAAVPGLILLPRRGRSVAVALALVVAAAGAGGWQGSRYMAGLASDAALYGRKVVLVGRAAEDGVYDARYQMAFSLDHVRVVSPVAQPFLGNVKTAGFGAAAVYRGDTIRIEGKLYPSQGNNQARLSFGTVTVLRSSPGWLERLRHRFVAGMQSALPEPQASFGMGLLVGQRNTLPDEISQQLLMVGLTHIIAVSGYNLTIIIQVMRRLLAARSKLQMTAGCVALIGVFIAITGSSPSIVRAGIVSLIGVAAAYYGRTIRPLVLILAAAAASVAANPLYLWGNISWYLSFLAFFGVLVVSPLVTRRLYGQREPKLVMALLIESLCAGAMAEPYILLIFGQTSLVSLPANLLVAPFIPLAMLLSLVAGLAGMALPALAGWVAWPATWLLTYMLDMAAILSRVPHAFVEHVGFPLGALLVVYAAVAFICIVLWSKTKINGIITDKNEAQREGA